MCPLLLRQTYSKVVFPSPALSTATFFSGFHYTNDNKWLAPTPNAFVNWSGGLYAIEDIQPWEEVTFSYFPEGTGGDAARKGDFPKPKSGFITERRASKKVKVVVASREGEVWEEGKEEEDDD